MTVDGAVFDKPQIGPAYDLYNKTFDRACKELYLREHYLPITNSGGLTVVNSKDEMIEAINSDILSPKNIPQVERK